MFCILLLFSFDVLNVFFLFVFWLVCFELILLFYLFVGFYLCFCLFDCYIELFTWLIWLFAFGVLLDFVWVWLVLIWFVDFWLLRCVFGFIFCERCFEFDLLEFNLLFLSLWWLRMLWLVCWVCLEFVLFGLVDLCLPAVLLFEFRFGCFGALTMCFVI